MAAQTSKFLFKCWKYFVSECREFQWNIFQHEKRNFVSSSDHVIYFFIQNPHKRLINKDVLDDFLKISKDSPKAAHRPHKCFQTFPKNFWRYPSLPRPLRIIQRCHIRDRVFINFLLLCLPLNKFYNTIILHLTVNQSLN